MKKYLKIFLFFSTILGLVLWSLGLYFLNYDVFLWGFNLTMFSFFFLAAYLKIFSDPSKYHPSLQEKRFY